MPLTDRPTDPVDELSDHAVPGAVESPVSEAGVVHWPDVVVELDDVREFVQQVRNVSDELLTDRRAGRRGCPVVSVYVVRIHHDVWLDLPAINMPPALPPVVFYTLHVVSLCTALFLY